MPLVIFTPKADVQYQVNIKNVEAKSIGMWLSWLIVKDSPLLVLDSDRESVGKVTPKKPVNKPTTLPPAKVTLPPAKKGKIKLTKTAPG